MFVRHSKLMLEVGEEWMCFDTVFMCVIYTSSTVVCVCVCVHFELPLCMKCAI